MSKWCLLLPEQFAGITLWLLLMIVPCATAQTSPEKSASAQEDVVVRSWIEPESDIVASQQVNLYIEVATPRWFIGGTRITTPEIDDVVVLRRERFAVNSTRREDQQTWSVQLWNMTLYPQRDGKFLVPALNVDVSVANENSEAIEKQLKTSPLEFSVTVPQEIKALANPDLRWLATSGFRVEEYFDRNTTELAVGSSVRRVIEIHSENLAAMMLPAPQFLPVDGLAVYRDPPQVKDRVNRGDYLATRVETITYMVEKEGTYELPPLEFHWWDLNTQSLQRELLPGRVISTEAIEALPPVTADQATNAAEPKSDRNYGYAALLVLVLVMLVTSVWWIRTRSGSATQSGRTSAQLAELERQYIEHCRHGNYQQAARMFFLWLPAQLYPAELADEQNSVRHWLHGQDDRSVLKLFDDLMAAAHSRTHDASGNRQALETLPQEIKKIVQQAARMADHTLPLELRLN